MKFITDIPAVENFDTMGEFNNAYKGHRPDLCFYIAEDNQYNAIIDGVRIEVPYLLEETTDLLILTYMTDSDSTLQTQTFSTWSELNTFIRQYKTTLTDINIYYGSTTEPTQLCRIVPADHVLAIQNMAYIEKWELIDNFYIWKPIGIIYPKIIFNNHVMTL